MKNLTVIAGLGNPEDKYEKTLHNAGFWFVDALARKYDGNFRYEKKFDADCCKIRISGRYLADQTAELYEPERRSGAGGNGLLPFEAGGAAGRA